jgi:C4-dicarboxylate-specific signal transduction histidine kinase
MSGDAADDPARAAAAEAWLAASDGLVAGIHHALNNRLGTLSALVQLAAGAQDPETDRALRDEMERCGATLRLLGLLPRRPDEAPIPLRLEDLLPDALALVRQHRDVRDVEFTVEFAPALLPVRCVETALVHALLTLLVRAGLTARTGGGERVRVGCSGDERFVTVVVEPEGGPAGGPLGGAGVAALFAAAGGAAEATATGVALRLPTLLAGRR